MLTRRRLLAGTFAALAAPLALEPYVDTTTPVLELADLTIPPSLLARANEVIE